MADYREQYLSIAATGATMAAVSVDPPETSERLRTEFSLPFPLLCDTDRRVVTDWNILNTRERGGIAKPAVFVLDPGRIVRFAAIDHVVRRTPAAEIVSLLLQSTPAGAVPRRPHIPGLSQFLAAIRNNFRH